MEIKWDEHGLIPAIVQDAQSGAVLMLAYMNEEALRLTQETGEAHFWSRSRKELWHKGATSGNVQRVREVLRRLRCGYDFAEGRSGRAGVSYRRIQLFLSKHDE